MPGVSGFPPETKPGVNTSGNSDGGIVSNFSPEISGLFEAITLNLNKLKLLHYALNGPNSSQSEADTT